MRRKSNFTKKRYLMIALFLMLIAGVSLGYAFLSTTLTINGHTKIAKQTWDIHFIDPQPNRTGTNITIASPDYGIKIDNSPTSTVASWKVTLSKPGDKYIGSIDVYNAGTIDGKLVSVEADTIASLQAEYVKTHPGTDLTKLLEYTVQPVAIGTGGADGAAAPERVTANNVLRAGEKFRLIFTLTFKDDIQASDLEMVGNDGIELDMMYKLNYEQNK